MGKLLPLILVLIGIGGGGGAGYMLRPAPAELAADEEGTAPKAEDHGTDSHEDGHDDEHKEDSHDDDHSDHGEGADAPAFVKLNNQFVVPVVYQEEVAALVVLSLTLETCWPRYGRLGLLETTPRTGPTVWRAVGLF